MINLIRICVPYLSHEPNTRRAPHGATTQARTRLNVTAAALAALLIAVAVATAAVVAPRPAQAQTTPNPPVCNRTLHIQWAILFAIDGITDCDDVTSAHLSAIDDLSAANSAELFGSVLTTLQAGDFNGMTGLVELRLHDNSLSNLPTTVFNGLTSLEKLYLWSNSLTSLHKDTFNGLSSIKEIAIQDNDIAALHKDTLSGLTTIEKFHAWGNPFRNLHEDTFNGLTNLEELWLSGIGISSLHEDTLDGLSNLVQLTLGNNALTTLHEDTFDGLSSLEVLWLHDNELTTLPAGIFNGLSSLRTLLLFDNKLTTPPTAIFNGLGSLQILLLNDNKLTTLPTAIFNGLSSLRTLWLNDNKLATLPTGIFNGLTSLTTLFLSGNDQMTGLPANIFDGLSALVDLRMEGLSPNFEYPNGLLEGLTNLDIFYAGGPNGYPPAIFAVTLVRDAVDHSQAKLRVPVGAPFDMQFEVFAFGDESDHLGLRSVAEPIVATGTTESAAFTLPTEADRDILSFVNNDGTIVVYPVLLDFNIEYDQAMFLVRAVDPATCGTSQNQFDCYSGFGFSNHIAAPDDLEVSSKSFNSARIVWESEEQVVGNRNFYQVFGPDGVFYGIHEPVSSGSQSIELRGLAPDAPYSVLVYGMDEGGILSMHQTILNWSSSWIVNFRTDKQPPLNEPIIVTAPNSLTLNWVPSESIQVLDADGFRDLEILGYQVRYKKTAEAMSAYSQWQTIETETTADGGQTTTLDWLFVSQLVGGELYDIQIRTITGLPGYVDPTPGYSEPATTTILTFIPVPGVNRIEPATPEVSVRAGDRIRLSADIYNSQDILDNDDAENGEGAFKKWQPELDWSSSGAGSFDDASVRRSIVYTAPSLPGVYTVTAEVGPPGLCRAHHPGVEEQDGDPCMAQFTLRVSREAEAPTPGPGPVNPAFMIPPRVTDDAGTAFSVFTPVEGGTFPGTGITVSARPGAVPDRAVLAVAATTSTTTASPDSEFTPHGTAWDVIGMSRTGGAGFTAVTEYRLDEPLTACLQVPWDQLDNLSNITVVEIRSDGLVGPLTSNLRTADGTTAACGRFSRVPATLSLATRADAASDTAAVPTADATQQELPEAGGSSPTVSILALVLLSGLATVAVAVAAAVAMRARRPAHTRATE